MGPAFAGRPGHKTAVYLTAGVSSTLSSTASDSLRIAIDADTSSAGNQSFQKVAAFTGAAAQMVLTYNAGTNQTLLALDVNGDGVSDFELLMTGSHLDPTGWML